MALSCTITALLHCINVLSDGCRRLHPAPDWPQLQDNFTPHQYNLHRHRSTRPAPGHLRLLPSADTKMMKITLVTCARYKVSFSFLSWYFLRPLYCQLGKSTTSATRLCQLVTGGHNGGGGGQTLARCHDMSRGGVTRLTIVWQECDAVMYLHFCHSCRRSCVM